MTGLEQAIKAIPTAAFLNWEGNNDHGVTLDWFHKVGQHSHELVRRADVFKALGIEPGNQPSNEVAGGQTDVMQRR